MADSASLLDEELSSFVFSYLTEASGSQVRPQPRWTRGTLGFPPALASGRVACRGTLCGRLMPDVRRLVSSISPPAWGPGVPGCSRTRACSVCECVRARLLCLDVWLSRVFWRKCHQPGAAREAGALKRRHEPRWSRQSRRGAARLGSARPPVVGMQSGARETFDATLKEV